MSERRPGTVLVLVVAVLSMLFVIGTAFLTTVTFENATIDRAKREMRKSSVIDKLSAEVREELKRGFVGNDGKAWNQDTWQEYPPASGTMIRSRISVDQNGEVAGVHPLIASLEPYEIVPGEYAYFAASDLENAAEDSPLADPIFDVDAASIMPFSRTNLVNVDRALNEPHPLAAPPTDVASMFDTSAGLRGPAWNETEEGGSILARGVSGDPRPQLYRRDADGDGVWDSYQYELPARYSSAVRGDLAEQLRDPKFTPIAGEEEKLQKIYYALRVIPHGAMVNAAAAHQTLLEAVFDPMDDVSKVTGPYVQEGEEPFLRRRFLLPSRDAVLSQLQNPLPATGQAPTTLYDAFKVGGSTEPLDNRWWPIDTGTNGDNKNSIENDWLPWVDALGPDADTKYYNRHLVTTVSHDDQLMRSGREPNAAMDWIDEILENESGVAAPGNYSIDEWPAPDMPGDKSPLTARLKISLPTLLADVIAEHNDPAVTTLDDILALPETAAARIRLIRTIQDGFMLMLRNVDRGTTGMANGALWDPVGRDDEEFIARTAAALTANLIDYADSDDDPTAVTARKPDGTVYQVSSNDVVYYGLEHQPFITEVYALTDSTGSSTYAVELFNPSDERIPMGREYKLITVDHRGTTTTEFELRGTIAPVSDTASRGFMTILSGPQPAPAVAGPVSAPAPDLVITDNDARIVLTRLPRGATQPIALDEFELNRGRRGAFGADDKMARSIQRDTGGVAWRAPVPVVINANGSHTLGAHTAAGSQTTRPVWLEPVNVTGGDFELAFPTTGSLLLIGRYANQAYDPTVAMLAFTSHLEISAIEVDNGRMPVFDTMNQKAQVPVNFNGDPLALDIPWGQLVFDYFTALPRTNPARMPNDMTPLIDMDGLRVHGRIDINSAPWTVLAGLPIVPMNSIPAVYRDAVRTGVYQGSAPPNADTMPQAMGDGLAKSIVAYREGRQVDDGTNLTENFAPGARHRNGTGFLTAGELANVRAEPGAAGAPDLFNIDGNNIGSSAGVAADREDFVKAAAVLIALGDWVTTRSHVFTVYGTLRGAGSKSAVDQRAIRFQETVDRLPVVTGQRQPGRVGPRIVGPYSQAAGN